MKRVGMTHDLVERKQHWKNEHPSLYNWKVRASRLTYNQALEKEKYYESLGYKGHPGGERKHGPVYSVYTFEY